jgi:hypothetical protein
MSDATPSHSVLIESSDLEAAAAAFCSRCGEPGAEAYRLMALRELLCSTRSLSQALESFGKAATSHFRGVHCTADMHGDVTVLSRALSAWSESVFTAGNAYRDWEERCASEEHGAQRVGSQSFADRSSFNAPGTSTATPPLNPA